MSFKSSYYLLVAIFIFGFTACEKSEIQEFQNTSQDRININLESGVDVENLATNEALPRSGGYLSFKTLSAALHFTGLTAALFSGTRTIYTPSDTN